MAQILDGKWVRDEILRELAPRVATLAASGRVPGLAVVLVGHDPASEIYVRNKIKACEQLGMLSEKHTPPETVTTSELLRLIDDLNRRYEIDGILVQDPLPKHVDSRQILTAIRPDKDVDGFHPTNVGNLVTNLPGLRACTPSGIIELLDRYNIPIEGRRAVVVGRSNIVGKPMAFLLLQRNATVTICHSRTSDLAGECRRADILVAAVGRPALITRDFIKPGATVIDVGMNRLTAQEAGSVFGASPPRGLIGDVHPVDVMQVAGAYTPVPGGVGPLTIAMLMANTVQASEAHQSCSASV
jgi:methylenetetrahydrofolate dehydrogenase (NADP+)/methenyltetrahydrofolate cyclohydrolase